MGKRANRNMYRRKMPSLSSSSQRLRSVSVMFSLVIIATLATLLLTLTSGAFAADATEDRRLGTTTVELIEGDNYFVEEESFEMEDQDMPDDEMDNNQAVRASGGHDEDELDDEEEDAGVIDEEDNYFDENEEDF